MYFSQQMMAVIQAVWTLRAKPSNGEKPGVRRLQHQEVEQVACDILGHLAENGKKPLVVRRQSWYGSNAKEEWKAIRRAIDGEQALSHHVAVEAEIAKFDKVDGAGALKSEINELHRTIARQKLIINDHNAEMEQVKAKAYFRQYVDMVDVYNIDAVERQHREVQAKLTREEELRQRYQHENNALRARIVELEKIAKVKGRADKVGAQPVYKNFFPSIDSIVQGEPHAMLQDYAKLKDQAWEKMMQTATKQPPTDIYLVFHRFNIAPESFVAAKLPLVPGVMSYIFACYEPRSHRRGKMFEDAAHLISIPPVVFLVEDRPSPQSNIVSLIESKPDITDQLHRHVVGMMRGFDYYDPISEGFAQVWIEWVS